MPDFEVFDRNRLSPNDDPQVTILRAGILSLNHAAYAALGGPPAVELMFDRSKRIIGLRAVAPSVRHASFVRPAGHSNSRRFLVTAKAFLHYHAIDTAKSRRWPAWFEDEILCLSLDDQSTIVTSNRAGTAAAEAERPPAGGPS